MVQRFKKKIAILNITYFYSTYRYVDIPVFKINVVTYEYFIC